MFDVIVVGAGFAGATLAERFATIENKKVLVIEKRSHIGGNMYDYIDENKVLRHEYGPHIFHTNSKRVVDYLSTFTSWHSYEHRVLGMVESSLVPIPFNLTSIEKCFDKEKSARLKKSLIKSYGINSKVPILELKKNKDVEIKELAEFIYEHVFKHYTMKQWGLSPEEIDPKVTGRVPILVGEDDRYFQDEYQMMPMDGYTSIFNKMLNHNNIEVRLNTDAKDLIRIDLENNCVFFENKKIDCPVIYTGAVDDLLNYKLGELPYRSLYFEIESFNGTKQSATTINYPTPETEHAFTRITEYKLMMSNYPKESSTLAKEFPKEYNRNAKLGNIPYYPIFTDGNQKKYQDYCDLIKNIKNLHLLGRLAEYKYYNMDSIIERSLKFFDELKGM
ncbi:MAG: UDP-galactopyranose mutase [Anaerorhabdus sp.]